MNSNWSYSPETPILVKINDFLSRVILKYDWWTQKLIGHLFYVASSFVHYFGTIGELKLEVQSGNSQNLGQNRWFFCPVWLRNLTDELDKRYFTSSMLLPSFVHHCVATGVTIWKRPIWVKIDDFFSRVTLKFDRWPWRTIGHLSKSNIKLYASFHHHMWIHTGAKLGFDLWDLDLWPLTLSFCMDITSVIGNNSWKFHVDTMTGTLWKRCNRQTSLSMNKHDASLDG